MILRWDISLVSFINLFIAPLGTIMTHELGETTGHNMNPILQFCNIVISYLLMGETTQYWNSHPDVVVLNVDPDLMYGKRTDINW